VWIDADNHHTASRNGLDWTAGMAGPERPGKTIVTKDPEDIQPKDPKQHKD
jgi:hypothetical protein